MIKILHVISDQNIGGAGRLLLNLISEADRQKFDISVVLPRYSALTPRIRELGIKATEINRFDLRNIYREIKKQAPHIVHTHASGVARVAAKLCGGIITVNTKHCAEDTTSKPRFFKRAAMRSFDRAFTDFTIATAQYVKDTLVLEGIPSRKTEVIINGSLPLKQLSDTEISQLKKRLGYTERDFLAGIVGRLERGKGQEIFIEAAKICEKAAPQIKFLIVGSGSMENELKKQAQGLGNLQFLGFLHDVTEIMNILDANVNCSYISETSSLSLSEGMSVGAIPIVSDCGGNRFMASDCGLVFPKRDAVKLSENLILLANDEKRTASQKALSTQKFSENFTAKVMTKKTEALYLKLLG